MFCQCVKQRLLGKVGSLLEKIYFKVQCSVVRIIGIVEGQF
jgi:hypothetical protein